jgi:hypothetical protein
MCVRTWKSLHRILLAGLKSWWSVMPIIMFTAVPGLHVLGAINSIASRTPYAAKHWHSGIASGAVLACSPYL